MIKQALITLTLASMVILTPIISHADVAQGKQFANAKIIDDNALNNQDQALSGDDSSAADDQGNDQDDSLTDDGTGSDANAGSTTMGGN